MPLLSPLISFTVMSLPAGLVVLGMICFYWGEAQAKQLHQDWDSMLTEVILYMPSVLHIVYTNMLATVYKRVAQSLTEYGEFGTGTTGGAMKTQYSHTISTFYNVSPHCVPLENHREESAFQNHLTAKVLVVSFFS